MGIKKRSKVSAEFNMSSLTDIIFLLLIFFMLTSSLVAPNSLNLKMPGSSSNTSVPSTDKLDDVRINRRGNFYFNGKRQTLTQLQSILRKKSRRGKYKMTISPDSSAPTEGVVAVMDLALRYNIDGILTAEPE